MSELRLDSLDAGRPLALVPSVWDANRAALAQADSALARELDVIPPPADWSPVLALDGSPTGQRPSNDASRTWRCGVAAPRTRARALLAGWRPQEGNAALPVLSTGAEIELLLRRLSGHQTLFVFVDDACALAALLRLYDWSADLRTGRLAFVDSASPEEWLVKFLEVREGTLPPLRLIALPDVPEASLERTRGVCQRAAERIAVQRRAKLDELQAQAARQSELPPTGAIAILALRPNRTEHRLARELVSAAEVEGLPAGAAVLDGPDRAHPLPHCRLLAGLRPSIVLGINHDPTSLPLRLDAVAARLVGGLRDVPDAPPDARQWLLGASPRVTEALGRIGPGAAERTRGWYWGLSEADAAVESHDAASDEIVLIADWVDSSAGAVKVEQPTQRALWAALEQATDRRLAEGSDQNPDDLLCTAERACGVALREDWLRREFLKLIEQVLIPSLAAQRIAEGLRASGKPWKLVGRGWPDDLRPFRLGDEWQELSDDRRRLRPLAGVVVPPAELLTPALISAAGLGWPTVLHGPQRKRAADWLGGVLNPGEHLALISGPADLRRLAADASRNRKAWNQRAQRARQQLLAGHRQVHRVQALRALAGLAP